MDKSRIEEILVYIEDHLDQEISLNDIAKKIHYSPYYCSTSFKTHVGIGMRHYILRRRLQGGLEDLEQGDDRILDIAMRYGYKSQEAFSRSFLAYYGCSPSAYRKHKGPVGLYDAHTFIEDKEVHMDPSKTVGMLHQNIKAEAKVLHILNGSCMLETFKNQKWMEASSTYVAFNEAMCWGRGHEDIFSDAFVAQRCLDLNSSALEYKRIVLDALEPLFNQSFDTILLWFGADMFCQMNMLTMMAYLKQVDFKGDVLFCMADEIKNEMFPDAFELSIESSYQWYTDLVCHQHMPRGQMMPVLYQGMRMYLTYQEAESDLNCYIEKHMHKPFDVLLGDLFKTFPQYGLGDLQYKMMIEKKMPK